MEFSPASHTAWETEDEMPTPRGLMKPMDLKRPSSSSRTPSRGSARSSRNRRSVTPPPKLSRRTSSPSVPGSDKTDKSDRKQPRGGGLATDESISILDPRRFTPTLHASLVGEILSLKRDREDKLATIETLEGLLQGARDEADGVQKVLVITGKENRSLKRQMALLEGGTSSALGELARERDEAVDAVSETKKRLEAAQRKVKAQEESAERTQALWMKEKDAWEEERRKADRKVHVLEARMKAILEEFAAFQANALEGQQQLQQQGVVDAGEDGGEHRNVPDSDAGSIRSVVRDSLRFSLLSNTTNKPNGFFSLADELDDDYDSDAQTTTETNGRESVLSNYRHMRNDSRASTRSRTQMHRRHHSGESLIRPGSVTRGRFPPQKLDGLGMLANGIIQEDEEQQQMLPKVEYTDSAVQYSPPPSPKLVATTTTTTKPSEQPRTVTALAAKWEKHHEDIGSNTEANQRRKRTSIVKTPTASPLPVVQSLPPPPPTTVQKVMVSAGAQTMDDMIPLSPPKTPRSPVVKEEQPPKGVMATTGTQTDAPPTPPPAVPVTNNPLAIPSIAVHPPSNRPSTPKAHRLPQFLKDFGCQVSLLSDVPTTSTGIQTEEIRIDQRLDKLPAHLHPSAISSRPTTPAEAAAAAAAAAAATAAAESSSQRHSAKNHVDGSFTPVPARNPRRLASSGSNSFGNKTTSPRASIEEGVEFSGEEEKRVLARRQLQQQQHRIGSMFDGASSADELDDFGDNGLLSESEEFRTALSAPRAMVNKSPDRSAPTSPEDVVPVLPASTSKRALGLRPSAMSNNATNSSNNNMRKAALIHNGINTHQEDTVDPPFPIPTRASSRHPVAGGGEQRSTESWGRKGSIRAGATVYRANSIRRNRSNRRKNNNSSSNRVSPPYSPFVNGPATPTVPPLPHNAKELATPNNRKKSGERLAVAGRRGHRHQNSGATATTDATTGLQSTTNSSVGGTQANGVVDAIAQTMVGEWMFKYVRRRKSFGMGGGGGDNGGAQAKDDSSNERHRRWVWLAPYERSILWSSKQPSSGSALLGKSGRKLTIQSVLDVKDDNPSPKGPLTVFNRSVLILTPQRALKFTAINAERHYLWLTALSFLAHSQQDVPHIPPPMPQQQIDQLHPDAAEQQAVAAPSLLLPGRFSRPGRPRIRDSIRLAKSHNPVLAGSSSANKHVRPTGGIGGSMTSQHHEVQNRTISPMPSIPDVPHNLLLQSATMASSTYNNSNNNTHHASQPSNGTSIFSETAAEPPAIPRFNRTEFSPPPPVNNQSNGFHGRKRSNTGGHIPPPLSFRGFAAQQMPMHNNSTPSESMTGGWNSARSSGTYDDGSIAGGGNLFEAIGTMRMEAFISPLAYSRYESDGQLNYPERKRTKEMRRRRSRSRSRSRSRTRGEAGGVRRGGVAGWREEYLAATVGGGGRGAVGGGYRTAGEEELGGGGGRMGRRRRRDPFEGF